MARSARSCAAPASPTTWRWAKAAPKFTTWPPQPRPKAGSASTAGSSPGHRPDPHFHKTISESFYLLSGTVRLYDRRRWTDAKPRDLLFVPPRRIHPFPHHSRPPPPLLLLVA